MTSDQTNQPAPGTLTWKEIQQHPAAWKKTLERAQALPLPPERGEYLFVGVGITYYLSQALARLAEMCTGRSARVVEGQEFYLYPRTTGKMERVCVLLSRSGGVTDTVRALEAARRDEVADTFALILGEEGVPAEVNVERLIECGVFEESVATTATLTSEVLAGVAGILGAGGHSTDDLRRLPDIVGPCVAEWDVIATQEAAREPDQIVFLGTGPRHGIARAAALSVTEMTLCSSSGYHTLVYPHGHTVTLTDRSLVVSFVSEKARDEELAVTDQIRALGARVAVVGEGVAEDEHIRGRADVVADIACGLGETAQLPFCPIFAQLLGYHLSLLRGFNPDRPPNLRKVF